VRKSKNKSVQNQGRYVSPSPVSFDRAPKNLKRESTTKAQKNWVEDTIIWGSDDAFPLRLAKAVQKSPATTACLDTRAQFIKGAGFSDKTIMKQVINQYGETLWQLHCKLSNMLAYFRGYAVNLKFNAKGQVLMAYDMPFENIRFIKPEDDLVTHIDYIKYNPYFGTSEYKKDYTKKYPLYDKEKFELHRSEFGDSFPGQVYYYGKTSPLYRFYPMPEYWSAEKWIDIDGKIQEFHAENLDNGFFQSVLMNVIGDPNQPSRNPKYQTIETGDDGVKRTVSTKTVGEEFSEMMSEQFSGSRKAGNVMALWSLNFDQAAKISAFPTSNNADLFTALQDLTTKNITIATKTPSILANISEGVSLGSAGSEIQKAIELMQATVVEDQQCLEDFYNNVLLPGMNITQRVEIVNFNPISEQPEIDDKIWEWLADDEKKQWLNKYFPEITITRTFAQPVAPTAPAPGSPAPVAPAEAGAPAQPSDLKAEVEINDNLKNMTGKQQIQFLRIIRQFSKGVVNEATARVQLKGGFGLTDVEIDAILGINETEE
jgi:hypothetical protein